MTEVKCFACGAVFLRSFRQHKSNVKKGLRPFCSGKCQASQRALEAEGRAIVRICEFCSVRFVRAAALNSKKFRFCSKSCAGKFRVASRPETAITKYPSKVGRIYRTSEEAWSTTLGELRAQHETRRFHAKVRGYARLQYSGPKKCAACGYSLHVEIAHLKGVAEFPDSATVAEVNAPENLAALDRRCHWEYDHGYLELKDGNWLPTLKMVDEEEIIV